MARTNKKLSAKALKEVANRHNWTLEWNNNYERQQASGFAYSMIPALKELYDTDEEVCERLETHMQFYNSHPGSSAAIIGATCALEESYQTDAANSIKVALMGPLAGIGDTIQGTLVQPLAYLLAAGLASEGSYLSLIVLVLPFVLLWAVRWPLFTFGYTRSVNLISDINGDTKISKFTEAASVLGLTVIGGFVPSMFSVKLAYVYTQTINDVEQTVALQDTLDGILPYMLQILFVMLCYFLIKKKGMNPVKVIGILSVVGFVLGAVGILS